MQFLSRLKIDLAVQTMISEWLSPDLGPLQMTHHSTCLIPSHSYDQSVEALHGGEPTNTVLHPEKKARRYTDTSLRQIPMYVSMRTRI